MSGMDKHCGVKSLSGTAEGSAGLFHYELFCRKAMEMLTKVWGRIFIACIWYGYCILKAHILQFPCLVKRQWSNSLLDETNCRDASG